MPAAASSPEAWVYLLACADSSLYCGWTTDLQRRIAAHAVGRASRYTRARLPVALAFALALPTRAAARRAEHAIKGLTRAEKLALAAGSREVRQRVLHSASAQ